ncbi:hypothetical protein V5O48_013567 [Marasmius crinis-equi]|uniref:Uncharacterized protein n=1 Tax=Marasmius crinis-equi TaxID=585013 RepID=A0ABR3EZQ3_9AGAR
MARVLHRENKQMQLHPLNEVDSPAMEDPRPLSEDPEEDSLMEDPALCLTFREPPEFLARRYNFDDALHLADSADPEASPRSRLRHRHRKQFELFYRLDDTVYLAELNKETRQEYCWHSTSDGANATLCPLFDEEAATFTIAGLVSRAGTCVQPHARYSHPLPSTPSLVDAQLRIQITQPHWPFSRDFDDAIDTISWWVGQQCRKDVGWSVRGVTRGDAWRTPGLIKSLQFRHGLFERVEAGDFPFLEQNFTKAHTKFSIAGWQVLPEAKSELGAIIDSRGHKVCPLPAFDIHSIRILPEY